MLPMSLMLPTPKFEWQFQVYSLGIILLEINLHMSVPGDKIFVFHDFVTVTLGTALRTSSLLSARLRCATRERTES